jgi:transcriptional regulator with XRE-family HTH domain
MEMTPDELASIVIRNVRNRRQALGLTQAELAERITRARGKAEPQVFGPYIAAIETGSRRPTLATLAELATALGIPPDLLLRDTTPTVIAS